MSLKVAVQMDHVATINPRGDSTFAMMLEAQARGHALLHYTPDTLSLRGRTVSALCQLASSRGGRISAESETPPPSGRATR